jgi:hypothetical protein
MDANFCDINRFKAKVNKFSGIISREMKKPEKKFIRQIIYGIQCCKDVKISNISRCLKESIKLIKTENRLCNHLRDNDFTEKINHEVLRLGKEKITNEMVIAIDPGDIKKPYAKAMENLCGIYDASEKEKATGYHLCQVTGANLEHNKIVPLYCESYSTKEQGYESLTKKIIGIILLVIKYIGIKGVWAIDRAGDNNELISFFCEKELKFVTRLKLNRWVFFNNRKGKQMQTQTIRLSNYIDLPFKARITKIDQGKETQIELQYGITQVSFKDIPGKNFYAFVIKGFGEKPMTLLTNLKVDINNPNDVYEVVERYLTRWKCDECFRYIKQSYNLEDVRLLSYNGVRNITVLVHAIAYFTSIWIGLDLKMKLMKEKIFILSKRFFGVPSFYNYAIADGIYELLKYTRTGIDNIKTKIGINLDSFQLSLFPELEPI